MNKKFVLLDADDIAQRVFVSQEFPIVPLKNGETIVEIGNKKIRKGDRVFLGSPSAINVNHSEPAKNQNKIIKYVAAAIVISTISAMALYLIGS